MRHADLHRAWQHAARDAGLRGCQFALTDSGKSLTAICGGYRAVRELADGQTVAPVIAELIADIKAAMERREV